MSPITHQGRNFLEYSLGDSSCLLILSRHIAVGKRSVDFGLRLFLLLLVILLDVILLVGIYILLCWLRGHLSSEEPQSVLTISSSIVVAAKLYQAFFCVY